MKSLWQKTSRSFYRTACLDIMALLGLEEDFRFL